MTSHKHDFQWHGRLPIGELAKLLFKLGHGGVNSFDFLVAMITSLLKYAIVFLLQTGLLIASLRLYYDKANRDDNVSFAVYHNS